MDRQLVQSGKLAAVGELASGAAHEINNPLFAILGLVEFLLHDSEPGTKSHERLLLIRQTGLEIKEIVKGLLDFARAGTDELVPVPLHAVVAEAVALIRLTSAAKNIEIVERYDGEAAIVGSPNQIKQVVVDLFSNAQHALGDESGTVTIAVTSNGDEATVSVIDDGPGIARDVLPRIFEPFFTTNGAGTGLGLAAARAIAQSHGGELTASSEPGQGATFRLTLPRAGEGPA
jgi:signal transduction histidine kinase